MQQTASPFHCVEQNETTGMAAVGRMGTLRMEGCRRGSSVGMWRGGRFTNHPYLTD